MANYGTPNQDYWAQQDPYAQPQQDPYAQPQQDPYAQPQQPSHHQPQQQHQQQPQQQHQSYNFEMPEQFGQDLNYTPFDASQPTNANDTNSFYDPNAAHQYSGGMFTPADAGKYYGDGGEANEFDNEPPLMEELGINPSHIMQKTLSVLNPFRSTEQSILQDTDMAGPLVFVLALGGFLLLSGKVTFSYIYGIGVLGSLAFYALLSLMATTSTVTIGAVISVLGYCLLPMVVLSGINVFITVQGAIGTVFAAISILWCAVSASKLFVTAYAMDHQQILIAYPCALLYGVFALITIF